MILIEHLFICLLTIRIPSYMQCLCKSFAHFKIELLNFFLMISSFFIQSEYESFYQIYNCEYLHPVYGLSFHSLWSILINKSPQFQWSPVLSWLVLLVCCLRNPCLPQIIRIFSYIFFWKHYCFLPSWIQEQSYEKFYVT